MQTYFGQVFLITAQEDDTACVLWVGLEVQALTTVAALQDTLQAYATLPAAVVALAGARPGQHVLPSALQAHLLQRLRDARPAPG